MCLTLQALDAAIEKAITEQDVEFCTDLWIGELISTTQILTSSKINPDRLFAYMRECVIQAVT